jgi:hypothetical protein
MDLHKVNNKLFNAQLGNFWCINEPRANIDSQNSAWPGLGGSHYLPSYSILCALPQGLHPNVILCRDSQIESLKIPEIPKIGIFATLEAHNALCRSSVEVQSKAKSYPSSRSFQWYVTSHLHTSKSGRFPTFSDHESNWQFDSQPFFWP